MHEIQEYFRHTKWTDIYKCGDFVNDFLKHAFNKDIDFNSTPLTSTSKSHGCIVYMTNHVGVLWQHNNKFYVIHLTKSGLQITPESHLNIEGYYATNQNSPNHSGKDVL